MVNVRCSTIFWLIDSCISNKPLLINFLFYCWSLQPAFWLMLWIFNVPDFCHGFLSGFKLYLAFLPVLLTLTNTLISWFPGVLAGARTKFSIFPIWQSLWFWTVNAVQLSFFEQIREQSFTVLKMECIRNWQKCFENSGFTFYLVSGARIRTHDLLVKCLLP